MAAQLATAGCGGGLCGLAMGPPTGCPLALARGMKRAIGQLEQLRECNVLPNFMFDA